MFVYLSEREREREYHLIHEKQGMPEVQWFKFNPLK